VIADSARLFRQNDIVILYLAVFLARFVVSGCIASAFIVAGTLRCMVLKLVSFLDVNVVKLRRSGIFCVHPRWVKSPASATATLLS
jgi:hypothetical protein